MNRLKYYDEFIVSKSSSYKRFRDGASLENDLEKRQFGVRLDGSGCRASASIRVEPRENYSRPWAFSPETRVF
ncbi:hypothetical protein [Salinibacillus aidingensis]|uniref:hypothetical protein n=1 Tax=Salinibacillus aidingensis TaxID=237684 RepID=UPI0031D7E25D